VSKEVIEKQINLVPSFNVVSSIIENKIYDYPHKDIIQAMFKEKVVATAPKKNDVAINMVLAITTRSQILKKVVFKEKEPFKNKSLVDWQEEEKLQCLFEEAIKGT
jgi:hypothetical protein